MEMVERPHAANLVRWAADHPEAVVLSADLAAACEADGVAAAFPARFFSMGMAEQNMMGFAAGLAREGFVPLVHGFATRLTRRSFDPIAMAVAYPNLPVRIFGFLPGITTPGGVGYQAIDDLALMRAIPNMTVLECGDATEVESCLDVAHAIDGPVYLRMLRGAVIRLFAPSSPLELGRARVLSAGDDVAVLSSGICTEEALRATAVLADRGVSVSHLHVSTLKPFDDPELCDTLAAARHGVVTLENHSVVGGLGSATAELIAERGLATRLYRLGLPDGYAHGASRAYLMREYRLDAIALVGAIEELLDRSLRITPADLAAVRRPDEDHAKPDPL